MIPSAPRLSLLDRIAGVALILEVLLGVVLTVGYVVYAILTDGGDLYLWGATIVMALIVAGIAAVARGWWQRKRFANGGVFATQMLYGAAGVWVLGSATVLGIALIAAALVTAVAALNRISAMARAEADEAER